MTREITKELAEIIQEFNVRLEQHLPALEQEVDAMISGKTKDPKIIENYLDTLLSLTNHGIGENLFIRLLEYYKTIDLDGALFYWNEYDQQE
ncbi:MAG: hypothetical protein NTZ69_05695 [Bacteroidia bacterium]|nr:hypothetical protein [Bacteroidia bacterium]